MGTDCSYERQTLCAFDALNDVTNRAAFLACMDEAPLTVTFNASFARTCAGEAAWPQIQQCVDGHQGDMLVAQAQATSKRAGSGIPKVLVDGKSVSASYDSVARELM